MKLTITSLTAALFAVSVTAKISIIDSEDASKIYPYGLKLGPKAEGASVDPDGVIYATDGSDIINLKNGSIALKGPGSYGDNPTSWLSSSRFLPQSGELIAGDAVGHRVFFVQKGQKTNQAETLFHSDKFLQPNDIAVTRCGRFLYFSGMNYTADSIAGVDGELAWLDLWGPTIGYGQELHKVSKEVLAQGQVYRSNGIEIVEQGGNEYLYLTSAQNKNFTVISTLVTRFELDKTTGEPKNPKVVLDIAKYIEEQTQGKITQQSIIKAGMDPDGMRADIAGNLYLTLNAYQKVLRWNTVTGDGVLVNLKTVAFPTNLELGGPKGDEVYVIGKCEGNKVSCIDVIKFKDSHPGRAFTSLQKLPKQRLRRRERWA